MSRMNPLRSCDESEARGLEADDAQAAGQLLGSSRIKNCYGNLSIAVELHTWDATYGYVWGFLQLRLFL